jgi:hypothetical protein
MCEQARPGRWDQRDLARNTLQHWLGDPDLAGLREGIFLLPSVTPMAEGQDVMYPVIAR